MSNKNLNEQQLKAATCHSGPLLIIAGAGTGKTRTVTHRIASLIESGVQPEKILAITFTNKAASEMKERVTDLLRTRTDSSDLTNTQKRPFISTFHSLGVYILRNSYQKAGLLRSFGIADRNRSKQIVKESARRLNIDTQTNDPAKVLNFISRNKNAMLSPEDLSKEGQKNEDNKILLWREYEKILKEENSVDFDDLLIRPVKLMESDRETRELYRSLWSHIHIDEYQDTNRVQCKIVDILAKDHGNICATGDLDQCIYSWRGAQVDAMLDFEKNYKGAQVIALEENYRSTETILKAANNVISFNRKRKDKTLFTSNTKGEGISYSVYSSETEEATNTAKKVNSLLEEGVSASEIAVLYRTNFQSRALEEAFINRSVPYSILGTKFLERQEVRDLLSYIELARNSKSISALKRIINTPKRGIGKVTLLKILESREDELKGKTKENIASFKKIIKDLENKSEELKPSEFVRYTLKRSGLENLYREKKEEERLENAGELISMAGKYDDRPPGEGIDVFLEGVALYSDQDTLPPEEVNCVRMMTVHAAKGLEFDHVFITGLEEGLFPHEPMGNENRDEEEERRLFYVALTRAKTKAFLSSSYMRTIFGKTSIQRPSCFISDIGEENLIKEESTWEEEGSSGLLSGPPLPPIY
ncbi:MAG: ATP-dependent helicase [Patescibacteria group bacterium]